MSCHFGNTKKVPKIALYSFTIGPGMGGNTTFQFLCHQMLHFEFLLCPMVSQTCKSLDYYFISSDVVIPIWCLVLAWTVCLIIITQTN